MHIKRVILFLVGLICLTSCENSAGKLSAKTEIFDVANGDSKVHKDTKSQRTMIKKIVFGVYCGECRNHCATMYCYFLGGNQNSFSADFTDSYFKKTAITFDTYFNDKFHFDIGNEIISNIPDILLNFNEASGQFGCPDCSDGCGIYFEITKDSKKQKFYIDYQTSKLSGDIKVFADFLKEKITQLNKKNRY